MRSLRLLLESISIHGPCCLSAQAPVHRLQKHVQKDVPAQLSLLRIGAGGRPMSVGDLRATVEPEPGAVRLLHTG